MYFAFGYGLYFYFTWLPTYLTKALGFSGWAAGLLAGLPFLLAGLADLAGGWLTDLLARAYGLKVARCWLGCVAFSGSAFLLFISTQAEHRVAKAIWLAIALASADLALSACWAVCVDVGKNNAGVITGLMNTFGNLGGVVGPLVVGIVLEQSEKSWEIPFHISAGIYASEPCCGWLSTPRDKSPHGITDSSARLRLPQFGPFNLALDTRIEAGLQLSDGLRREAFRSSIREVRRRGSKRIAQKQKAPGVDPGAFR